jgi:L-alanine-DL-glutamate epimerase-like enolase superfamily enzyme
MPRVTEFRLYAVDLPFRKTFRHAAAERRISGSLFLRARLDSGAEGWGECLPRPYVSGESREGAFALLRDTILPSLLGQGFKSFEDVISFLEKCDGKAPSAWIRPAVSQSSAWCCVDLALIDAFAKTFGEAALLRGEGVRASSVALEEIRYSGVVSADRGWRYWRSLLKMRAFGFPTVKVKLDRDGALRAARIARRLLGRRVELRVDANMAWKVEQALDIIGELRTMGIDWFEQPIDAKDLDGLARLVRESSAGIIVDEGMTDRESLETLICRRASTGVNVRISKCGGLVAANARCREALDAGLTLQVGCQVGESSLLSAAHVRLLSALTRRSPGVRFAEGCFGRHLLREDPFSPTMQFRYGGRPPILPPGLGLGLKADDAILERWTVDETRVSS